MDKKVKEVFKQRPTISFHDCSAEKPKNYLGRTEMYPIGRTVGSKDCGSKLCEVCINVNEATASSFKAI